MSQSYKYLLDVSELRIPLSTREIFGNSNEFSFEIGSGDGEFLCETALLNPGTNYIGIEIKSRRVRKASRAAGSLRAENVRFLHMEAGLAVRELFLPDTVSVVYINFPDPWPKDRHHKHRVINDDMLGAISTAMRKDGTLEIASDHVEYMETAQEICEGTGFFRNDTGGAGYKNDVPGRAQTKYERKFREEGRRIYYMKFTNIK